MRRAGLSRTLAAMDEAQTAEVWGMVDRAFLAEVARRGPAPVFATISGAHLYGFASPDSDVDLLYELAPGARLGWEIEDLSDELAAVIGRPVDLVSRRALHEQLRDAVLAEAQQLYAA